MVAATADKVVVELEARTGRYNATIKNSTEQFNRNMRRIEGSSARAESVTRRYFGQMSTALSAIGPAALGAGLGIGALAIGLREVSGLADKFTRFENRLKTAGIEGENLTRVGDKLFATANKNGVEIEALGAVYARASLASDELGASQQQLDTFTGAVSDALRVQGSSAEASRGALLQLSQALGQDIVRGEEFNSILEGALPIAQAAAKGIDRFGGSVARLRTAVINGEVTSREFFNGIIKQAPELALQAAKANLTLENSFTALYNQLARGIGQSNKSLGATEKLSAGILYLADNLDTVATAIGVISAAIGSKLVAGLVRAGAEQAKFYGSVAAGNAVIVGGARAAEQKALATLSAASADEKAALSALNKAKAVQASAIMSVTDTNAEFARAASIKQVAILEAEATAATVARTRAETVHAAALGRTAIAARAAALAMRAYSALSGLLGGPVGIALTALAATYLIVSSRTQAAAERTTALQDELRQLGYLADDAADKLDGTKEAIEKLAGDQLRKKLEETKRAVDDLRRGGLIDTFFFDKESLQLDGVKFFARQFRTNINPAIRDAGAEIENLVDGIDKGTVSADEIEVRLDALGNLNLSNGVNELLTSLRKIAPTIIGGLRRVKEFQDEIENLGVPQDRDRTTVRGGSARGDKKTGDFLTDRDRESALDDEAKAIEKRAEAIKKEAKAAGAAISPMTALAQARKEVLGEQDRDAAKKASEKLAADAKQSAQVVADLQNAIATFGNERQQAIDSAVRSLPEGATAARVEEVKRLSAALFDMHEAERISQTLSRDASQEAIDYYSDQAAQVGVVGAALVELQFEQARYNEIRAAGIPITEEIIRQVKAEAAVVRGAYEEIDAGNEPIRNQIAVMDQLRQGFVDIGTAGIHGFDSLGEAAQNFLSQIADMILQIYFLKPLMESLFDPMGSKSSGAIGGALAGLFSGGAGFASGTANTGGVRGQPRGVVHGQEAVIPLPNGGKVPVDLRMPEPMRGGSNGPVSVQTNVYVETGQTQTTASGVDQSQGRELGRLIEQNVKDVIQRQQQQGGILWNPGGR